MTMEPAPTGATANPLRPPVGPVPASLLETAVSEAWIVGETSRPRKQLIDIGWGAVGRGRHERAHCAMPTTFSSSSRRRPGQRGESPSTNTASRSRRTIRARFPEIRTPSNQRAQGKPGARCTRGLVCKHAQKNAHEHTGSAEASGLPCAMVLRLITRSPRRSGFLVTVTSRILPRGLTPASGRQDHTTSPSASRPFVKGPSASTASRPAFRDDRERPSCRVGRRKLVALICPTAKAEYFLREGWTGFE
jgi:hypothetical protein